MRELRLQRSRGPIHLEGVGGTLGIGGIKPRPAELPHIPCILVYTVNVAHKNIHDIVRSWEVGLMTRL